MTTPTAAFAIQLKDKASGSAKAAASALTDLKQKISDDLKALQEMQKALRNLKGSTSASASEVKKLSEAITAQKAKIAAAQAKYIQLGGTFGATQLKTASLSSQLSSLGGSLGESSGMVGTLGGNLSRLGALLSNPIVLVGALTSGLLAFVAAIGVTVAALGRYALAQSDARRSELLRLEGLTTLRTMFGRVTASANEMQQAIDRASDSTGLARSQAEQYARSFAQIGFHGEALAQATEGMALAALVQGERGAARFRALAVQAALTGRSVRDVAEAYRQRLGPIAQRIMLSLPNQANRLRMSLERIFSGLRIEKFLGALDQITRLFSQQTATGRALKAIIEAIFQPMFNATETLGPIMRRFFQGLVIGALLLTIGFLRVRNALRDVFGDSEILSNQQLMTAALVAGVAAVFAFATAATLASVVVGLLAVTVLTFVASMLLIPAAIIAAGLAIEYALGAIVDWFQTTDFGALAQELINGLVGGLLRGAGAIRSAVTSLANTARNTFRSALGISSPSRVFAQFGVNIAEGLSRGVDRGQPAVEESVSNLVEAPQGGGVGQRVSISTGDVIINAQTNDPEALAEAFRDKLASILEGVSIELGAT